MRRRKNLLIELKKKIKKETASYFSVLQSVLFIILKGVCVCV